MTEDLTNRLHAVDDKLSLILTIVQSLTVRVDNLDSRLECVDARLERVDARLERVDARLERLDARLEQVEQTVEHLKEGQQRLEGGQKRLRSDLTAFRRHVDLQFRTLSGTVEGRFREHDQRIARLEANANQANSQT